MQIQNGASPPMPKACQNLTYLVPSASALTGADLYLLFVLEVLLWIA